MNLGGAIMWVILAMSVAATTVVIERLFFFASESSDPAEAESSFARGLDDGIEAARSSVSGRGSMRRLFLTACDNWDLGSEGLKDVLGGKLRSELFRWEKNIFFLEITAKVSTLLGLLGTVLGMVEMFRSLNIGGSVSSTAVTGGIWKALFTTVAGLTVAVPMIVIHGILDRRITVEEEKLRRGADFIIQKSREREKDQRR
jgi:biopolymer transport protein ExbB